MVLDEYIPKLCSIVGCIDSSDLMLKTEPSMFLQATEIRLND